MDSIIVEEVPDGWKEGDAPPVDWEMVRQSRESRECGERIEDLIRRLEDES